MKFLVLRNAMRVVDPSATDFDVIRSEFQWSISAKLNVAHQVCERHQARAQRVAVYCENVGGERASYSFGDLKRLSDQFANALRATGIKPGDQICKPLSAVAQALPRMNSGGYWNRDRIILKWCKPWPMTTTGKVRRIDLRARET